MKKIISLFAMAVMAFTLTSSQKTQLSEVEDPVLKPVDQVYFYIDSYPFRPLEVRLDHMPPSHYSWFGGLTPINGQGGPVTVYPWSGGVLWGIDKSVNWLYMDRKYPVYFRTYTQDGYRFIDKIEGATLLNFSASTGEGSLMVNSDVVRILFRISR